MDTSETTEQPEKHFYADWADRIKNILRSENNSLTFVVGQQQISFNRSVLCFLSPVVDNLVKQLTHTSYFSSVDDHIYLTLTDHKFAKSLAFLQKLLQTGIIQHISCSDAENLPGLFAFLELDISFDSIEATTILPKYETKAEASDSIMDIKTEIVKSETGVIFPKVEIKEEDHHGEMEIKIQVKSEPDDIFDSNLCSDTEYVEVEEEVNGIRVKTEAAKCGKCFKDSSATDYSPGYMGPSPLPVGRFQYSIVTPWFDQQVHNEQVSFSQDSPFNNHHTEEYSPFNNYHTKEPSHFSHYHTKDPSPFNNYHTDAFSIMDHVSRPEEEGLNKSRSGNSNVGTQKGEKRKLFTEDEDEHTKEKEMKVDHLRVFSSTLWIGHLSKHVEQLDLSDLFSQYGEVVSIELIPSRGCAYVVMKRRIDACAALEKLQTFRLRGEQIKIVWAPGKDVKYQKWKEYFDYDIGAFFIPFHKLDRHVTIAELEQGRKLDQDENWAKTIDSFKSEYGLS